ncbi:MAG: DinB family protein [Bacteroidota bacterium]|nr:DinB family protein [Bacteroidota bacterium]
MEIYHIDKDIEVIGFPVKTFPQGIGEAFSVIQEKLPPSDNRPFYGISECTPTGIVYLATAQQKTDEEPVQYGFTSYKIEKGDYLAVTVRDWPTKTNSIKEVFTQMFTDDRSDRSKPCVEIYKNEDEMLCLVKAKTFSNNVSKNLLPTLETELDDTIENLAQFVSKLQPEELNKPPMAGNWTAGQIVRHIIKVNSGFLKILNGPTQESDRNPEVKVNSIKANLLDFTIKRQAGDFVAPEIKTYQKEELLKGLEKTRIAIKEVIQKLDLSQTCIAFEVPVFGYLTRLEALHFVIYHTQRHTQQLNNLINPTVAPGTTQSVPN